MIASDFLTGMKTESFYQYSRAARMILRHESVFLSVESLNADDSGLKRLENSHLDELALYATTMKAIPILVRAASNFVKSSNKPAGFHATTV